MGFFKSIKDIKQAVVANHPAPTGYSPGEQNRWVAEQRAAAATHPEVNGGAGGDVYAPIAGVTLEQYAKVCKGLGAHGYDQSKAPEVAASMGIDGAAWAQASEGFNARVTAHPEVAQRFNAYWRAA